MCWSGAGVAGGCWGRAAARRSAPRRLDVLVEGACPGGRGARVPSGGAAGPGGRSGRRPVCGRSLGAVLGAVAVADHPAVAAFGGRSWPRLLAGGGSVSAHRDLLRRVPVGAGGVTSAARPSWLSLEGRRGRRRSRAASSSAGPESAAHSAGRAPSRCAGRTWRLFRGARPPLDSFCRHDPPAAAFHGGELAACDGAADRTRRPAELGREGGRRVGGALGAGPSRREGHSNLGLELERGAQAVKRGRIPRDRVDELGREGHGLDSRKRGSERPPNALGGQGPTHMTPGIGVLISPPDRRVTSSAATVAAPASPQARPRPSSSSQSPSSSCCSSFSTGGGA